MRNLFMAKLSDNSRDFLKGHASKPLAIRFVPNLFVTWRFVPDVFKEGRVMVRTLDTTD